MTTHKITMTHTDEDYNGQEAYDDKKDYKDQ
jgi:hypothetical protein